MSQRMVAARGRLSHLVFGSEGPRRYLAPGLTVPSFFAELKRRDVRYVVLRWFESLPHVEPGEDIDILVADEDLQVVQEYLVPRPLRPRSQKFDLYSASGLPGTDFGGVPYYPPRYARKMLGEAVWWRDSYRVPSVEDRFLSLAYHAVYHKGYASGLRTDAAAAPAAEPSDHDYAEALSSLVGQLGLPVASTLDELDLYLHERGLRPPLDTLHRLEPRNPWIFDRFFRDSAGVDPIWQGLAIFVLRERAESYLDLAAKELDRFGFEILEILTLTDAQREAAAHRLRGGNWERGPFPLSGGAPYAFIVAYDVVPRFTSDEGRGVNLRIPVAKARLRDSILAGVGREGRYNPVHSSDNPHEALDYLEVLDDEDLAGRLEAQARGLLKVCAVPFPVERFLGPEGPARRARVALVRHPVHGESVCKVFRPGAYRFFEREVHARTQLHDLPEVPQLLDHGDNWLLTPVYRDSGHHLLRRLPFTRDLFQLRPAAARAVARFALELHERGLFVLDLSALNLMSDPVAGLKILDLEFLQEYVGPVPELRDSYTVRGLPTTVRDVYDQPHHVPLTGRFGNSVFHPAVSGLPFEKLLAPRTVASDAALLVSQLAWYGRFLVTRPFRVARNRLPRSRRAQRLIKLARQLPLRIR